MAGHRTVLIVDDDPKFVQALRLRCQDLGLEVRTASDGLECLILMVRNPPDLLVLDLTLPGADGLSVCEKIARDPQVKQVPVIVLTGRSDEDTLRRIAALGARYVHKGLEVWAGIEPMICDLLGVEARPADRPGARGDEAAETGGVLAPPKILVVDDDPQITRALAIRLGALGFEVIRSPSGNLGKLLAKTEKPDLIITDHKMPEVTGEQLLVDLKEDPKTRHIPVIVLTGVRVEGKPDYALRREMLGRRGAVAYLVKPLDFDALLGEMARYLPVPPHPHHRASAGNAAKC